MLKKRIRIIAIFVGLILIVSVGVFFVRNEAKKEEQGASFIVNTELIEKIEQNKTYVSPEIEQNSTEDGLSEEEIEALGNAVKRWTKAFVFVDPTTYSTEDEKLKYAGFYLQFVDAKQKENFRTEREKIYSEQDLTFQDVKIDILKSTKETYEGTDYFLVTYDATGHYLSGKEVKKYQVEATMLTNTNFDSFYTYEIKSLEFIEN